MAAKQKTLGELEESMVATEQELQEAIKEETAAKETQQAASSALLEFTNKNKPGDPHEGGKTVAELLASAQGKVEVEHEGIVEIKSAVGCAFGLLNG